MSSQDFLHVRHCLVGNFDLVAVDDLVQGVGGGGAFVNDFEEPCPHICRDI